MLVIIKFKKENGQKMELLEILAETEIAFSLELTLKVFEIWISSFLENCIGFFKILWTSLASFFLTSIYLFKVNKRNARTMWKMLYVNIRDTQWRRSGVFIVNFDNISNFLVFLLLVLWKSKCLIQTQFWLHEAHKLQVA